jgi:hypothetical protein
MRVAAEQFILDCLNEGPVFAGCGVNSEFLEFFCFKRYQYGVSRLFGNVGQGRFWMDLIVRFEFHWSLDLVLVTHATRCTDRFFPGPIF